VVGSENFDTVRKKLFLETDRVAGKPSQSVAGGEIVTENEHLRVFVPEASPFAAKEFLISRDGSLEMAPLSGSVAEAFYEPFGCRSGLFVQADCGFEEVDCRVPFVEHCR
jgi:hypothetical protein